MRTQRATLTLAAVCLAAAGCQSTAASGSDSGGQAAPVSLTGKSAPAVKGGYCVVGPHTIENLAGTVTGTLAWECHNSVLMILSVRLVYVGNNTEHETEVDEGSPIGIDSVTAASPTRLTAPCTTGLWKMKIVGTVTPAVGTTLTLNTSDKVNPPFNDPKWQTPTAITC